MFKFGFISFAFLASSLIAGTTNHYQEIKVPLGLVWGDSFQKLEEMARPGGFSIAREEETGSKAVIMVHGLLGVALKENLFVFQKNALVEMEYRYGDPTWNAQHYQDFFDSFRRMYDAKYGPGTQLIRMNSKESNDIATSLIGYQWSQSSCILELFYYSAEQSNEHAYRLISLHYKAP